jgi:peroxiredoxin
MSDLSLSWEQRYGPRRILAEKYPTNWALQFALQEPLLNSIDLLPHEWDLAIERYRSLPDPLLRDLLEARLLAKIQPVKSGETIGRILGQAKDSPWAHLAMLESAADSRNGDRSLAEQEFQTFRRMCPGERLVFRHLASVQDLVALKVQVQALRTAIESDKQRGLDEQDLELLRTAWTFERLTFGPDRLHEFRDVVRSDLASLRDHPNYNSSRWVGFVSFGYVRVLGEPQAVNSLEDEILRRAPQSEAAYGIQSNRWSQENPPPGQPKMKPGEPIPQGFIAASDAYGAKRAAFMVSLIERFWGRPFAANDAANLLDAQSLPPATFERMADFVLSDAERNPDQLGRSLSAVQMSVAQAYVARKIRLDRVPALVAQAEKEAEDLDKYTGESAQPGRFAADIKRQGRYLLIGAAIGSGQMDRAQAMLRDFRRDLDAARAAGNTSREDEFQYQMLANQAGIDAPMNPDLLASTPRQPERVPVPSFEAKDLSGKTWSAADLKGKVTWVLIWRAEACGSCAANLQGVQQLYERWKDRPDRAVLTISMDVNAAIVQSFMKENGYSFPVIYGRDMAQKILGVGGWPAQWLIDPQGRRTRFRPPRDSEDTIADIEEMADKIAAQ